MRFLQRLLVGLLALPGIPARGQAPVPILSAVLPPAGQAGGTVRVTLEGKNLERVTELRFDHPGFHAVLYQPAPEPPKADAKDKKKPEEPSTLTWDITIDGGVPSGLYDLRAVNALGISAPRAILVSAQPVVTGKDPEKGAPVDIEIDTSIFGSIEEGLVERFRFKPTQSAKVVVECFAERIDSKADATLEVRESVSGKRLAFSRDRFASDPALAFEAKSGVEHTIELWDFTYRGKFPYLLRVSGAPRAVLAFPPAIPAAGATRLTFFGWNLPGGKAVAGASDLLESLTVEITPPAANGALSSADYRDTTGLIDAAVEIRPPFPGAEPLRLALATTAVSLEKEPNDSPASAMALALPAEVCGRFDSHADRDWFSLPAKKGEVLEIEVRSARLGAPTDPVLLVARRSKKEKEKSDGDRIDDILYLDERKSGFPREDNLERKLVPPERDPYALWTVPDDGEYLLQIRNRSGRSGVDAFYHLSIRPPRPTFTLAVTHSENLSGEAPSVPRGASQSFDLFVERRGGFAGGIKIEAEGLPTGLTCPPVYLGPNETYGPLVLTAAADAGAWTGSLRVFGSAEWQGAALRVEALSSVAIFGGVETRHPLQYSHSRLATSIVLSVREASPFAVTLEPTELTAYPGAKLGFTAKLRRGEGFDGAVQLAYQGLGERCIPDDNGSRNAKTTIEKEKTEQPIEITLRNDLPYGDRTFTVFATAQADYPEKPTDPSSKKQKRRTTLVSNPVMVRVVAPYSLNVPEIAAVLPAGGSVVVPFSVKRAPGVDAEIEVSLDLPKDSKGLSAATLKLKKGEDSGSLVLESDVDAPAGEIKGLKVRARAQIKDKGFDEKGPSFSVRRVEPLRVVVGEIAPRVPRGGRLAVPFRVERVAGLESVVTVSIQAPKGIKGLDSKPLSLDAGRSEGVAETVIGTALPAELDGLFLEATIERKGKKLAVTAPIPRVTVESAFKVAGPLASARLGCLRLECLRQGQAPREREKLRVRLTAASGQSAQTETFWPEGQLKVGVLLDVAAFPEKAALTFPLRVELTVVSKDGEVSEEHVVRAASEKLD